MNENNKVTIYGERLKHEAKKHGWKNRDMCDFLGYQNEKTISKIYSGIQRLPDKHFKALSNEWGLREDYLRCIDDFPTDDDILKYASIEDKKSFIICKNYLESIGITFEIVIETDRFPVRKLYDKWDEISPYLTSDTITSIKKYYDFSLNSREFHNKYFTNDVHLRWQRPFDDIDIDYYDENIGKRARYGSPKKPKGEISPFQDYFMFDCASSKTGVGINYEVGLKIYYKGTFMGKTSHDRLQVFMRKLDKFTLFLADDLLFVK